MRLPIGSYKFLFFLMIINGTFLIQGVAQSPDVTTREKMAKDRQSLLEDPTKKALLVAYTLARHGNADISGKLHGSSSGTKTQGQRLGFWDYWTKFKNYMRSLFGYGV